MRFTEWASEGIELPSIGWGLVSLYNSKADGQESSFHT